jgi:glycosyltransferase involved in cell wall biosynthesis
MRPPLVSCIVPVFNGERFLGEALDSILAQTHQPLEVIVVDDGSRDGTSSVADRYGGRITYLRQDNKGPATAKNVGVRAARGEYVAFLEQDDVWLPEKLARQVALFRRRPGVDLSFTAFQNFWMPEVAAEEARYRDHPLSRPSQGWHVGTLVARRSAFETYGRFETDRRLNENMLWHLRAAGAGASIDVLPEVLMRRRLHLGNATRQSAEDIHDLFLPIVKAWRDYKRRDRHRSGRVEAPLVSCIVPVHNGERFLAEAVDSILAQTWRPLEVLVIDDGSTDGTPAVLARYTGRVRAMRRANAGPAVARNSGLAAARGEFVAFLDADDLWHPEKLSRQMARFEERPELEICLCHVQNFWTGELSREEARFRDHRIATPLAGYSPVTLLARRAIFDRLGPFRTDVRHVHDTDWFMRATERGAVMELMPDVLVQRRLHPGNRTRHRGQASRDEYLELVKARLDSLRPTR